MLPDMRCTLPRRHEGPCHFAAGTDRNAGICFKFTTAAALPGDERARVAHVAYTALREAGLSVEQISMAAAKLLNVQHVDEAAKVLSDGLIEHALTMSLDGEEMVSAIRKACEIAMQTLRGTMVAATAPQAKTNNKAA